MGGGDWRLGGGFGIGTHYVRERIERGETPHLLPMCALAGLVWMAVLLSLKAVHFRKSAIAMGGH